jgi:hypothetical protein
MRVPEARSDGTEALERAYKWYESERSIGGIGARSIYQEGEA